MEGLGGGEGSTRELQQKTMQDLHISQGQVASQAAMLKSANEKINALRDELSKSWDNHS